MDARHEERVRREEAQSRQGEVVPGSGRPVEASGLEQMISVRLGAEAAAQLRGLAEGRHVSLSALIREALSTYAADAALTSQAYWKITGYEGTVSTGEQHWIEAPESRSALREQKDDLAPT